MVGNSAKAYLDLTLALIRYRVHSIHRDPEGRVLTPNRVIAKISRIEVARIRPQSRPGEL